MFSLAVVAASAWLVRSDRTLAYRTLSILPAAVFVFVALVPFVPFVTRGVRNMEMNTGGAMFMSAVFLFSGATTWLLWNRRVGGLVLLGLGLLNGANSVRLEGVGVSSLARVAAVILFGWVAFRLAVTADLAEAATE